jgi:tetraacyldisaccharide 4'-kinase
MWQRKGIVSTLLLPFSGLAYLEVLRRRRRFLKHPERIHHSHKPVVVVGNIFVGGTGKTPLVIALVKALQQRGWQPGVISRGYGVQHNARPLTGHGDDLDPASFGDEPALIAAETGVPVAVHPLRVEAIQRLEKVYPHVDVIITDDGLQHLALGRDMEIAVQDERGTGNGRLLPAGPLREPAERLDSVDFVITTLSAGSQPVKIPRFIPGRSSTMTLEPVRVQNLHDGRELSWNEWHMQYRAVPCSAVAGIGNPERFFSMLEALKLPLQQRRAFADHHPFDTSPFQSLNTELILITTKDAVKCRRWADPRVWVIKVEPVFSDPEWLQVCHDMLKRIAERKNQSLQVRSQADYSKPVSRFAPRR